jgi:hypothetical protein
METLALTFGQRVEHAPQPMLTLAMHETQLRIGLRVDHESAG